MDERRDYYDVDDIYPAVSDASLELSRIETLVQADEEAARKKNDLRLVIRDKIPLILAGMKELNRDKVETPLN